MCVAETGKMYLSVTRPGSLPEAYVPGLDVLGLWSIFVLGNGNHCKLTVLGSQDRILLSSEQEDIGKSEAVTISVSNALCVVETLISICWPCLIHQKGQIEEAQMPMTDIPTEIYF